MKFRQRFSALLLCCALIFCACGKSAPDSTIRYDLESAPETLDPQYAQSSAELSVIKNIFEGLTEISPSGEVLPACAESWSVSDNGLIYTFKLRGDIKWADGEAVTADDFAFALGRLFNPEAVSPSAENYAMIKNARSILSNELPPDSLGVSANGERELVIELERDDPSILTVLSMAAASPCQRAFFGRQKGRYGLDAKSLLCNGPFLAQSWGKSSITLKHNEKYRDAVGIENVALYVGRGDPVQLFLDDKSDVVLVPFQRFADAHGIGGETFYDQSWLLLINPESGVLADGDIRAALVSALDVEEQLGALPEHLEKYNGAIAPSAMIGGSRYRDIVSQPRPAQMIPQPRQVFLNALQRLEKNDVGKMTLLVSSFSPGPQLGGSFQRAWQQKLSSYINMEQLDYSELLARVSSSRFDMAIVPLVSQSGSTVELMSIFEKMRLPENGSGGSAAQLIISARQQTEANAAAEQLFNAEQQLIDDFIIVPLFAAPSVFASGEGISGVYYDTVTRTVYFADARCER